MLHRLKKRLKDWVEDVQRREIERLLLENIRLKQELEQETGRPVQLTPEQQTRLAELSQGMDPDKKISVFGPEQFTNVEIEKESAENS